MPLYMCSNVACRWLRSGCSRLCLPYRRTISKAIPEGMIVVNESLYSEVVVGKIRVKNTISRSNLRHITGHNSFCFTQMQVILVTASLSPIFQLNLKKLVQKVQKFPRQLTIDSQSQSSSQLLCPLLKWSCMSSQTMLPFLGLFPLFHPSCQVRMRSRCVCGMIDTAALTFQCHCSLATTNTSAYLHEGSHPQDARITLT